MFPLGYFIFYFIEFFNLRSVNCHAEYKLVGTKFPEIFSSDHSYLFLRARTDYANRACNVMLVAKLVPRTADEPSAQRTASILRSLIDRTAFHRHRDECLCCKKSNSAHNICLSLIHTRRINNSTSFRFTAVILLTTS
jgi:hypothetical protein